MNHARFRRNMAFPAAAIAVTSLVAACGTSSSPATSASATSGAAVPASLAGPVTINYWERYCDPGVAGAVARFNRQYQGKITVKDVCVAGSETNLVAKIQAAAAGGGLPDVATASEQYATEYANSGLLVNLGPYLASKQWGVSSAERADFYPGAIGRTNLPVYGNKTLSWPFGDTANALYVNLKLLHAAGIASPPATWQEFAADVSAIKRKTGKPGWVVSANDGADLIDALRSSGVEWINAKGTAQFDNPTLAGLLKAWQPLFKNGSAAVSSDYKSSFVGGNAGMVFASSGYATTWARQVQGFSWTPAMYPHGQGRPALTELYGSVDVAFRSTPRKELASWLFMKYVASAANQAQMCPAEGCMPATKSSLGMPAITAAIKAAPQYGTAINVIAPAAKLLPQNSALADVRSKIAGDVLTQLIAGQLTPGQAATELQQQAQQAIGSAG